MKKLYYKKLEKFIATDVVRPFYDKRIERLNSMSLKSVLKRKNPYLFKAKNIQTAGDLARYLLDAFLSSQEETIFGDLLEGLAIHIAENVYGGKKAEEKKFKSVDLIFRRDNTTYVVGIKSGPNWGNSDQINTMRRNLKKAKEILRKEGMKGRILGVNGCMYGVDNKPFKKHKRDPQLNYYKICGQEFWELISDDSQLYKKIIQPLDKEVKKRDEVFRDLYNKKTNELTKGLIDNFYKDDLLDWDKILDYVSKKRKS